MNARKPALTLAAVALAATGLLTACGGSSRSSASASASSMASTSMAPSPSLAPTLAPSSAAPMVGGDPSTWTPVSITMNMNGTVLKLVKGQSAIFTDLPANDATNKIVVVAKKKGVVKISQQGTQGGSTTVAGLTGLKKGVTKVLVYDGDPKSKSAVVVMQFTVRVKKATPANIAAAANALAGAGAAASAAPSGSAQ